MYYDNFIYFIGFLDKASSISNATLTNNSTCPFEIHKTFKMFPSNPIRLSFDIVQKNNVLEELLFHDLIFVLKLSF